MSEQTTLAGRALDVRPEVLAFAWLMELKLRKHDDDRGESWKTANAWKLFHDLKAEVRELEQILWQHIHDGAPPDKIAPNPIPTAKEAADIANFGMMIGDVLGGLDVERARRFLARLEHLEAVAEVAQELNESGFCREFTSPDLSERLDAALAALASQEVR